MAQINPDSITNVPAAEAAPVPATSVRTEAPRLKVNRVRPAATLPADTAIVDTAATDSVATDTSAHDTLYYILLEREQLPAFQPRVEQHGLSAGLSWIMGGLLLLFLIIAIRFHNNSKYLGAMLKSAVEVRERGNVFDDTVRETSFVILLNLMWAVCVGILLFIFAGGSMGAPGAAVGMGISIGLSVIYELFLGASYWVVGSVFSDHLHTRMWLRGFLSANGLTTLILFPVAMMALCYPANAAVAVDIGLIAVIIGKIIFIWKGFRIFFSQIGSWVLFLYYLCSLEIVPLVLLYAGTAFFMANGC